VIPGAAIEGRQGMNEDVFNMSLRKFLKKVGVTSQREIEKAVRAAVDEGRLSGKEKLNVVVSLKVEGLKLSEQIDGRIELE
jgi:ribosomal protein L1